MPAAYRVHVAGPPPGTNTAIGAITGALIGAALGGRHTEGVTTLFGAVAGAAVGSAADAQNAQNAHDTYVQDRQAIAALEQGAAAYRRAVSACLQGRGYSVR